MFRNESSTFVRPKMSVAPTMLPLTVVETQTKSSGATGRRILVSVYISRRLRDIHIRLHRIMHSKLRDRSARGVDWGASYRARISPGKRHAGFGHLALVGVVSIINSSLPPPSQFQGGVAVFALESSCEAWPRACHPARGPNSRQEDSRVALAPAASSLIKGPTSVATAVGS